MQKNFAVLAINPESKSTKRFIEEGEKKGHKMFILDPTDIVINTDRTGTMWIYQGAEQKNIIIDGVIARIGGSQRGLEILHALYHNFGIESTTTPYGVLHAGNKNLSQYLIAEHRKPQPKTSNINTRGLPFDTLVGSVNGLPCIFKTTKGSQGSGVYLFKDEKQSKNTLYNFKIQDVKGLLQEFIETSKENEPKKDIRVIVVGNKVVASMERSSTKDDVRSNYTISKQAKKVTLTQNEVNLALKIAEIFKLEYAGIDLMREAVTGNTLVCEVNSCPGLGIEDVTGVNVARYVIELLENKVCDKPTKIRSNKPSMIHGLAALEDISNKGNFWANMDKKYGI